MEKQKLLQSNEELKGEIVSINERIILLDGQLSCMKSSQTLVESEFSSYKEKAKSILKQKDDLITSLQEGSASLGRDQRRENQEDSPYLSEINALKYV
jgi:predicted nuclease with TOPRIM domain